MIANMRDLLIDQSQLNGDLSELNTTIESANYLIKLLTNNNSFIRKNIVDIYIPYMNKKIVEYTDILGLLHICTINNDLSSDISYMGKNVSYYNLSQGERLRVNLAVNLAFRDLLSSLGKSTNILMVDEWLDSGSDESLVSRAMGLLKTKADHVVIISHKSEIRDYVDRVVTITKRNGFSVLEDDIL
jgi:DNA repair exonuclease SbcCD ATPase subunit